MKVKLKDSSKDAGNIFSRSDYGKALYDYEKIQLWMTTLDGFLPALKHLEAALKKIPRGTKKRLTGILEKRELSFGINQNGVPTYTAVLSGPEFVRMSAKAVLPKDHVTPEHGEFTHRLHWYIVLHNMSAGFTEGSGYTGVCYYNAATLLQGTTKKDNKPPQTGWPAIGMLPSPDSDAFVAQYEPGAYSLWEALFDRRPHPKVYSVGEDWISCPEMFTALLLPPRRDEPKTLDAYRALQLLPDKKSIYGLWVELPELSFEIQARYDKRSVQMSKVGGLQPWVEWYRLKKAGPYGEPKGDEGIQLAVPGHEYFKYKLKEKDKDTYRDVQSKAVLIPRK